MECHPTSASPRQLRKDRATASTTSSSKRSWRKLRPLRLRVRSAATDDELPDLVFVDPSSTVSSSLRSSTVTTSSLWKIKKPSSITQRVPSLETTEVTLETERSADDQAWVDTTSASKSWTGSRLRSMPSMDLVRSASLVTVEQARTLIQNKALTLGSKSLYAAAAIGFFVPPSWILYSLLVFVLVRLGSVWAKWIKFYWNDPEMAMFRRNLQQLLQRFTRELELTVQGNYARQIMASYVFWATTAPGDSIFMAILRYKMNIINMRVIEEIQSTRDSVEIAREKFHGYRTRRVRGPFA